MHILVTNDDGIFSPLLIALAEVADRFGQVRVVAPDVEQSAMGHAVTIQRPLQYHAVKLDGIEAYRVNGTPADCVALVIYHWESADLVLSGVNLGSNLGHEIWHSGTVAAAKQAALLGVRAFAFSLMMNDGLPDFEPLKPVIEQVITLLLEEDRPRLVNVNLPPSPQGIQWTFQSVRSYNGKVIEGRDPNNRKHYWFTSMPLSDPEPGSDRAAVNRGYVSLTPLRLDISDENELRHQSQEIVEFMTVVPAQV